MNIVSPEKEHRPRSEMRNTAIRIEKNFRDGEIVSASAINWRFLARDDERRREQNVIAAGAVDASL